MDEDAVKAKEAGCDGYVTKPCERERLLEEVRRVIDNRPTNTEPSASVPATPSRAFE
jgi:DNA-binding response OmpR family regulator